MALINNYAAPTKYDPYNRDHQDWLMWWLDQFRVPFSDLDDFGFHMESQPPIYLQGLYLRWQKGLLEKRSGVVLQVPLTAIKKATKILDMLLRAKEFE